MKNKIKWPGIISLVAVIGLAIAACGGGDASKGKTYALRSADGRGEVTLYEPGSNTLSFYVPDGTVVTVVSDIDRNGRYKIEHEKVSYDVDIANIAEKAALNNPKDKERKRETTARLLGLALSGAAILVLMMMLKHSKTRSLSAYTAYYVQKRREYPWLDKWIKDNIDPTEPRAEADSTTTNVLLIIIYVAAMIISNFFGVIFQIIVTSIGIVVLLRFSRRAGIEPGKAEPESGLTLECPSCHCPHSWVMPQKENILENKETITETTTRSGYGKGDFFDSMSEGFKRNGTTEKVTVVYTGRSFKDFKCLNCGHTEQNEYEEEWRNQEPKVGLLKFNPPRPAWEMPKKQ